MALALALVQFDGNRYTFLEGVKRVYQPDDERLFKKIIKTLEKLVNKTMENGAARRRL